MAIRAYRETLIEQRRLLGTALAGIQSAALKATYDHAQRALARLVLRRARVDGRVNAISRVRPHQLALALDLSERTRESFTRIARVSRESFVAALADLGVEVPPGLHVELSEKAQDEIRQLLNASFARVFVEQTRALELTFSAGLLDGVEDPNLGAQLELRARGDWWKVERVVRTLKVWVFNEIRVELRDELQRSGIRVGLRWTEHVNDATGRATDDRVAVDSLYMHGQVAFANERFTMPANPKVERRFWRKSWVHPPNRPNDRAVLVPWVPGLDVPAWNWRSGTMMQLR